MFEIRKISILRNFFATPKIFLKSRVCCSLDIKSKTIEGVKTYFRVQIVCAPLYSKNEVILTNSRKNSNSKVKYVFHFINSKLVSCVIKFIFDEENGTDVLLNIFGIKQCRQK